MRAADLPMSFGMFGRRALLGSLGSLGSIARASAGCAAGSLLLGGTGCGRLGYEPSVVSAGAPGGVPRVDGGPEDDDPLPGLAGAAGAGEDAGARMPARARSSISPT
jgi:hypothetical protein